MSSLARHSFGWHYVYLRLTIGILRSLMALVQRFVLKQQMHEGVVIKNITVPSRDKGRNIQVHIYQPAGYDSTKQSPVVINWHGSGFAIPSLGANHEFCSLVAARTQCLVLDADYRKAPEFPFPAALLDAEDIVYYLAAHPSQYDASNIFLSGFSAGGTIALVTASTLGPERVKGVISFYPVTDCTKTYAAPEKRIYGGSVIPDFILYNIFYNSYILPNQPRTDPRVSVIFAQTESFPKHVYMACGNGDGLYTPANNLMRKLKEAGHLDAEFVTLECMGHGFDVVTKEGTEAEEKKRIAYDGAVDMINRIIGTKR